MDFGTDDYQDKDKTLLGLLDTLEDLAKNADRVTMKTSDSESEDDEFTEFVDKLGRDNFEHRKEAACLMRDLVECKLELRKAQAKIRELESQITKLEGAEKNRATKADLGQ